MISINIIWVKIMIFYQNNQYSNLYNSIEISKYFYLNIHKLTIKSIIFFPLVTSFFYQIFFLLKSLISDIL